MVLILCLPLTFLRCKGLSKTLAGIKFIPGVAAFDKRTRCSYRSDRGSTLLQTISFQILITIPTHPYLFMNNFVLRSIDDIYRTYSDAGRQRRKEAGKTFPDLGSKPTGTLWNRRTHRLRNVARRTKPRSRQPKTNAVKVSSKKDTPDDKGPRSLNTFTRLLQEEKTELNSVLNKLRGLPVEDR